MKTKSTFLILFCFFACAIICQAQTPKITAQTNFNEQLCTNTLNKIPVQISGNFNTDNRFQIELLSYSNREVLGKYEAAYENGSLAFTIDSDLSYDNTNIYFQIITTSPVTKSYQYERRWSTRGNITISLPVGQSDTVNRGVTFPVNVRATANNQVNFTLSDSSTHESMGSPYQQTLSLVASKAQDIFIVKAVNSCGVLIPFSGKIPVKINPISIIPGKVVNQTALCEGSEMELGYFVTGGVIPESATFKLRLLKQNYSSPNEKRIFEIPAQIKANGLLVARIPDQALQYINNFRVAILVDKPGLVSSYSEPILIHSKPTVTFRSQSETVNIGEKFGIWLNIVGPPPFTIELNNGVSYQLGNSDVINLLAYKTESFSIRSLKSACGLTTDLPKESIVLTVQPGIAINASTDQKFEICENQRVRIPFISNTTLNSNTKFSVEGRTDQNTTYEFAAKLIEDSLEFFVPQTPVEWVKEGYYNIKSIRIKTSNPSLVSEYRYGFTIRGIPTLLYESVPKGELSGSKYVRADFQIYGGTPVFMEFGNGFKTYTDFAYQVQTFFVDKSGTYGLKSIKNKCYTNTNLPSLNLTVTPKTSQAPAILVYPPTSTYFCDPDSVEIYFETFGQFDNGNEFQIFNSNNSEHPLLTVKKPGRYKVPTTSFDIPSHNFIIVKASKPEITATASTPYILESKPQILNADDFKKATVNRPLTFEMEYSPAINLDLNNFAYYSAEFTDGITNYDFQKMSQYESFKPPIQRSKITPFTIKSVTNICGTTPVNITSHLLWYGYKLSMNYFQENKTYCSGEEINISFQLEKGTIPPGTTYNLQIAKGDSEYRTVATNTTGEDFKFMVPDTMAGKYSVRINTENGPNMWGKVFYVNKKPTATVSLSYPSMSEIEYDQSATVVYTITGGMPWEVILKDHGNIKGSEAIEYRSYILTKSTVFELQSVSNQCGYGTVSGKESVRVKPKILEFKIDKKEVCKGGTLQAKYQIGGDIGVGEHIGFYLTNKNGTRFDLLTVNTPVGNATLTMPPNLGGEGFELTFYVAGTDLKATEYVTIRQPADVEIIGNTTVNSGQSASITLRSASVGNTPVDITLSDGTNVTFNAWSTGAIYNVGVMPKATTTYSIASAKSSCGNSKFIGSAVVTVNPPFQKTVQVVSLSKWNPLCENDTILVSYSQTGSFSAGNQFTAQFYDSQGRLAKSVPTTLVKSLLQVILPAGFSTTDLYRLRLSASDANTGSGDYRNALQFGVTAIASFGSTEAYPDENGVAKVVVLLSGTGPWTYRYGNELASLSKSTDVSPDTLLISNKEPTTYFKLLSVQNGCGNGTIGEPSTVKIELILGNKEAALQSDPVTFGPNPTQDEINLQFKINAPRKFLFYDEKGIIIWQKTSLESNQNFDVHQYPSGTYLLKIQHQKGERTLKIIKR